MIRNNSWAIGVLASAFLLTGAVATHSQQKAEPPKQADRTKADIENAAKAVVAAPPVVPVALRERDLTKSKVERPTEAVLARARMQAALAEAPKGFVNPKVAPGKVNWHPDLATACAAAKTSGKPVLLFQMMGKLDDQFC